MSQSTTYQTIASNRWRTLWLLLLFPAMVYTITFLASVVLALFNASGSSEALPQSLGFFLMAVPFVTIGALIWLCIALISGRSMVLAFAGAKPIAKRDHPELVRTVENIALQTGVPTPDIYIIEDESMNAFATGYSPKRAAVAITRGLLQKLTGPELEAVMAHEMGHILHRDTRIMLIAVTMVGIVQMVAEIILRMVFRSVRFSSDRREGAGNAIFLMIIVSIVIWLIAFIGAFFVQMGISRRREYMADAESVHITRHAAPLISALQKIHTDARVEVLDGKRSIAAMCIADPLDDDKRSFFEFISGFFSSHPSLKKRVEALEVIA